MDNKVKKIIYDLSISDTKKILEESLKIIKELSYSKYDQLIHQLTIKYDLFDEDEVKLKILQAFKELKAINEQKLYITVDYRDYYDEYNYKDNIEITRIINNVIKLIDLLMTHKRYYDANKLLECLFCLEVAIFDDYSDELIDVVNFENVVNETSLICSTNDLSAKYIEILYYNNKQYDKMYEFLDKRFFDISSIFEVLNLESTFYQEWLSYLLNREESIYLFIDIAITYLNDEKLYKKIMYEYGYKYPHLYLTYLKNIDIYNNHDWLAIIKEALNDIQDDVVKNKIFIVLANYYQKIDFNEAYINLIEAFKCQKTYDNFLPLLTNMNNYQKNKEYIENNIDITNSEYNQFAGLFLNHNYNLKRLNEEGNYYKWSENGIGQIVALYLILLDENKNDENLQKLIKLYYKEPKKIDNKFSFENDLSIYELLENLKSVSWLSKLELEEAYSKILEIIDRRIDFILSNTFRGAYERLGIVLIAIDKVSASLKKTKENEIINYYLKKYSKYRAFKTELLNNLS